MKSREFSLFPIIIFLLLSPIAALEIESGSPIIRQEEPSNISVLMNASETVVPLGSEYGIESIPNDLLTLPIPADGRESRISRGDCDATHPEVNGDRIVYYTNDMQCGRTAYYIVVTDLRTGVSTAIHMTLYDEHDPELDGDLLVWCAHTVGKNLIQMMDLKTGGMTTVSGPPVGTRGSPVVSGSRIAWGDTRDKYWNIEMYDLLIKTEVPATSGPFNRINYALSGDRLVYQDERYGNSDLFLLDIPTHSEIRITQDTHSQEFPDIYGSRVVWQDNRNGNWDIYSYDTITGAERQITSDTADQVNPKIWEDLIAWQDNRNGNGDIYLLNLTSGIEIPFVAGPSQQVNPAVHGNWVVWLDNRDGTLEVYAKAINAIPEKPWITIDPITGNIINGDQATVRARTSLPAGTEIIMDVVSKPAPIGSPTAQEFAGTAGVVQVIEDTGSANTTSFSFNTEHFITEASKPYTYLITAESPVFNVRCQTEFRLLASKPLANFTAIPTSGFTPLNVTFIETSTRSPTSWLWNFGDGTLSTEESPLHTYQNPGVYTVSLTAINQLGQNAVTKRDLITVYPDTFGVTSDTYINTASIPPAGSKAGTKSPRQTNYGSESSLNIVRGSKSKGTYGDWQGSLIRVDLPPIPEDLIDSVTLNIYHGNPSREDIAVHRMLKDWRENEASYDRPNAGAPSWAGGWVPGGNYAQDLTAKVSISQAGRWYAIDVTSDIKAYLSGSAPNNGWFLKSAETIGDDSDATAFVSREGRIGQRPYLTFQMKRSVTSLPEFNQQDKLVTTDGKGVVRWGPSPHADIIEQACKEMGFDESHIARDMANVPDKWAESIALPPPFNLLNEPVREVFHSVTHYYNPELKIGFAPMAANSWANNARIAYRDYGDHEKSAEALGYSSHFLTDVGNPMHTGMEFEQFWDRKIKGCDVHTEYENWTTNNWRTGSQFYNTVAVNGNFYRMNNPQRTTINVARYSHGYLGFVFNAFESGSDSGSCSPRLWEVDKGVNLTLRSLTEKTVLIIARNANGLVEYVKT
jgi:beta propeller repeat protein